MTSPIKFNGYPRTDNAHEYIANSATREVAAYCYGDGQALATVQELMDGRWTETLNIVTTEAIAVRTVLQFARGL